MKAEYYGPHGKKIQLCPNILSKEFLKKKKKEPNVFFLKMLLLQAIIMKKKCSKCELMKYKVMNI